LYKSICTRECAKESKYQSGGQPIKENENEKEKIYPKKKEGRKMVLIGKNQNLIFH